MPVVGYPAGCPVRPRFCRLRGNVVRRTKLRIIGAAVAASVLLFPLSTSTATAAPDDAARVAGKHWGTIGEIEGALHQACRVSVDNGAKWKSGYVTPGNISAVGSVLVPRKPGYKVEAGMYSDIGGGGEVLKIASLNRC